MKRASSLSFLHDQPFDGSRAAMERWNELSTVCVYLLPPSKVTPEKQLRILHAYMYVSIHT